MIEDNLPGLIATIDSNVEQAQGFDFEGSEFLANLFASIEQTGGEVEAAGGGEPSPPAGGDPTAGGQPPSSGPFNVPTTSSAGRVPYQTYTNPATYGVRSRSRDQEISDFNNRIDRPNPNPYAPENLASGSSSEPLSAGGSENQFSVNDLFNLAKSSRGGAHNRGEDVNSEIPSRLEGNLRDASQRVYDAVVQAGVDPRLIRVNSAYRSPEYNRNRGGRSNSGHLHGHSIDFHIDNGSGGVDRQAMADIADTVRSTQSSGGSPIGLGLYPNFMEIRNEANFNGRNTNWGSANWPTARRDREPFRFPQETQTPDSSPPLSPESSEFVPVSRHANGAATSIVDSQGRGIPPHQGFEAPLPEIDRPFPTNAAVPVPSQAGDGNNFGPATPDNPFDPVTGAYRPDLAEQQAFNPPTFRHNVQDGDTRAGIANEYGMNLDDIPENFQIGEELTLTPSRPTTNNHERPAGLPSTNYGNNRPTVIPNPANQSVAPFPTQSPTQLNQLPIPISSPAPVGSVPNYPIPGNYPSPNNSPLLPQAQVSTQNSPLRPPAQIAATTQNQATPVNSQNQNVFNPRSIPTIGGANRVNPAPPVFNNGLTPPNVQPNTVLGAFNQNLEAPADDILFSNSG